MPPALDAAWHTHGYYGSVSHNVKAIYQRYLGWYDGNPAHLWQHPPEAAGARYVEPSAASTPPSPRPRSTPTPATCASPPSWPATPCSPNPPTTAPRTLLADVLTRLGYGAECATWRNIFLPGARSSTAQPHPPRSARPAWPPRSPSPSCSTASPSASTDSGPGTRRHRSAGTSPTWTDLPDGAVQRRADPLPDRRHDPADLVVTLTKPQLLGMLAGAGADGHNRRRPTFATIAGFTDDPTRASPSSPR